MKDVVKTLPDKSAPKRRRRKRNLSLYYLLILAFVGCVLFVLSRTVLFNINEFTVAGNKRYTQTQILSAGDLEIGDNLYALNIDKTVDKIKDVLIYIDDVTVSRKLPDTLEITVTEAVEFACCQYEGNRYAVISRGGRYLETEQPNKRDDLIMVYGLDLDMPSLGDSVASKDTDKLSIVKDLFAEIDKVCSGKITYLDITDRTNIRLGYENRIDIHFGSSLDYEYKLKYINAIITDSLKPDDRGRIIYHSSAAGASFISEQDLLLQENQPVTTPSVTSETSASAQ